ncbi:MAG TPA: ATP-binding cassette domain-containing protein [bacterium]|nr:ATP-binding cassette domain-containing protein [Myxococcales bacterium]HPW46022.1 ATP-binding cassette domain-containing protein [bacterium]HQG12979.1 ATP-binding cassette domain-containing protein [bacterium]
MIKVSHINKSFGKIHAVNDISFEIAKGEVVGLLGPNGAGKTTTMRLITGYLSADSGEIKIEGIPVDEDHIEARKKIGYLPENAPLYHEMETVEFIKYIGKLRSIEQQFLSSRIDEVIETCGLANVAGRMIGELSKGYRQRVGLAAAMIHKPQILILDEPTSGLDPNQIFEIRELIKNIGRERTVMLSTHIMQEAEATCGRVLIINSGELAAQGTISEILKRGKSKIEYTVSIRAKREDIENALQNLIGFHLSSWINDSSEARQRFALATDDGSERSEEIFSWAVKQGFTLSELTHNTLSLEEVFRELTQG